MQLLYVNEMWEKLFEICLPSEEEEKNVSGWSTDCFQVLIIGIDKCKNFTIFTLFVIFTQGGQKQIYAAVICQWNVRKIIWNLFTQWRRRKKWFECDSLTNHFKFLQLFDHQVEISSLIRWFTNKIRFVQIIYFFMKLFKNFRNVKFLTWFFDQPRRAHLVWGAP